MPYSIGEITENVLKDPSKIKKEEKDKGIRFREDLNTAICRRYDSGIPLLKKEIVPTKEQSLVLKKVKEYQKTSNMWPYLYGTNGVGKTMLAIFLGEDILKATNDRLLFKKAPETFPSLYKKTDSDSVLNTMKYVDKLILDDLFAHRINQSTLEAIFIILDYRSQHSKPTIITSNFAPNTLKRQLFAAGVSFNVSEQLCKSITDRIFGLCIPIEMSGGSHRISNTYNIIKKMREEKEI